MKKIESLAQLEEHLNSGTKWFKYSHNGRMFNLKDVTLVKTSIRKILNAIKHEKLFVNDWSSNRIEAQSNQTINS